MPSAEPSSPHMPLFAQQLPMLPTTGIMMLGQLESTAGGGMHEPAIIAPHLPAVSSMQHAIPPSKPPSGGMHVVEPHFTPIPAVAMPPGPPVRPPVPGAPPPPASVFPPSTTGPPSPPPSLAVLPESSSPQPPTIAPQNISATIQPIRLFITPIPVFR